MTPPFVSKRPAGEAPWVTFGCDCDTYEKWVPRVCAMACAQSLILGLKDQSPSLWELTQEAQTLGVYKTDKASAPKGAFHHPLAKQLGRHGFAARVFAGSGVDDLQLFLAAGNVLILSIDLMKLPTPQQGSHLILVYGYSEPANTFFLHDNASVIRPHGKAIEITAEELGSLSNGRGLCCRHQTD